MSKKPSSKPPRGNTIKIGFNQEAKEQRVAQFIQALPESDMPILRDLVGEILGGGLNDAAFGRLKQNHGLEAHRIDYYIQELYRECCSDQDEIALLIQERLDANFVAAMEASEAGENAATQEMHREAVRQIITPVPEADVSPFDQTIPSSRFPSRSVQPSESPSEPPANSGKKRKIVVSRVGLKPQMSHQEFVEALTDEGKEMLRELLLLNGGIADAEEVEALEKRRNRGGYVRLAMHVNNRLTSSSEARKELADALKSVEPEAAPFTVKGKEPGRQMTVSPWAARPPVQSAESPKPSLAQLLAELSEDDREKLKYELCRDDVVSDDKAYVISTALARFFTKMAENEINPHEYLNELKALLVGNPPVHTGGDLPFIRPRNPEQITVSPWRHEIGPKLLEEVGPFFDHFTPEAKLLLVAVLNTGNPDDPEEAARMIREYAPGNSANAFEVMNQSIDRFAKRLGRPEEDVRKALSIRLDGGQVLSGPSPREGMDPRQQPTILSTHKQRGILSRILGKKKS